MQKTSIKMDNEVTRDPSSHKQSEGMRGKLQKESSAKFFQNLLSNSSRSFRSQKLEEAQEETNEKTNEYNEIVTSLRESGNFYSNAALRQAALKQMVDKRVTAKQYDQSTDSRTSLSSATVKNFRDTLEEENPGKFKGWALGQTPFRKKEEEEAAEPSIYDLMEKKQTFQSLQNDDDSVNGRPSVGNFIKRSLHLGNDKEEQNRLPSRMPVQPACILRRASDRDPFMNVNRLDMLKDLDLSGSDSSLNSIQEAIEKLQEDENAITTNDTEEYEDKEVTLEDSTHTWSDSDSSCNDSENAENTATQKTNRVKRKTTKRSAYGSRRRSSTDRRRSSFATSLEAVEEIPESEKEEHTKDELHSSKSSNLSFSGEVICAWPRRLSSLENIGYNNNDKDDSSSSKSNEVAKKKSSGAAADAALAIAELEAAGWLDDSAHFDTDDNCIDKETPVTPADKNESDDEDETLTKKRESLICGFPRRQSDIMYESDDLDSLGDSQHWNLQPGELIDGWK